MRKYRILIVEDERQLADLMCLNFPSDQFIAKASYNGKDALEQIAKERPDLVILDVMMSGMDGWEVLSRLKADPHTSSIPVIMCTGKDSPQDVDQSFRRGAQAYVMKPVVFQNLLRKVAVILDIEELLHG